METHLNKCIVCGNEILKKTVSKPHIYCCQNCSDYAKYKNALEKSLIKMQPTKDAKSIIRGDMFRMANLLSSSTVSKK